MNKKAIIGTGILISIIIILITAAIIGRGIFISNNNITSNQEDITCRYLIEAKSNGFFQMINYISEITQKCKKDKIEIEAETREDTYKGFAEEAKRCWYRYGEGEQDFLERYKAIGNWCFTCGEVSIKKPEEFSTNYNDFVFWMKKNSFMKGNEKINYANYINLNYVDATDYQIKELESEINSLKYEVDSDGKSEGIVTMSNYDFINVLSKQYENLITQQTKTIISGKKYYVVYSYQRKGNDLLEDVAKQATYSAVGGIMGSILVEGMVEAGIAASAGLICGPAAVVCSPVAAVGSFIKTAVTSATKIKIFKKTIKIIKKMNKLIKKTKTLKKINNIIDVGDYKKLENLVKNSKISELEKGFMKKDLKTMESIEKTLNNKIQTKEILKNNIDNIADMSTYSDSIKNIAGLKKAKIDEEIKFLKSVQKNLDNIPEGAEEIITEKSIKSKAKIIGLISGATVGALYPIEKNFDASIKIMDKEEYYRTCGTLPEFK